MTNMGTTMNRGEKIFLFDMDGTLTPPRERVQGHVIKAMNNDENIIKGAVRISWCHLTDDKIPIEEIQERLQNII